MSSSSIHLPIDLFQSLSRIAEGKGKTAEEYVRELVETEVLATASFDEILAPIRKGFKESRMSADEITVMFERVREEVYQESLSEK